MRCSIVCFLFSTEEWHSSFCANYVSTSTGTTKHQQSTLQNKHLQIENKKEHSLPFTPPTVHNRSKIQSSKNLSFPWLLGVTKHSVSIGRVKRHTSSRKGVNWPAWENIPQVGWAYIVPYCLQVLLGYLCLLSSSVLKNARGANHQPMWKLMFGIMRKKLPSVKRKFTRINFVPGREKTEGLLQRRCVWGKRSILVYR